MANRDSRLGLVSIHATVIYGVHYVGCGRNSFLFPTECAKVGSTKRFEIESQDCGMPNVLPSFLFTKRKYETWNKQSVYQLVPALPKFFRSAARNMNPLQKTINP